jgi:nucleolin
VNPSVFRRFSSDDAKPIESADADEAETIRPAVESSAETATGGVDTRSSRYDAYSDEAEINSGRLYRNRDETSTREQYGTLRLRPERVIAPNSSVYVGNLLFEITAADLEKEFAQYGTIKSSTVATDNRGLSKGYVSNRQLNDSSVKIQTNRAHNSFAYIEFETVEQAKAAIEGHDELMARTSRPERSNNPPSKTIFIGNLAYEMSDSDLNKLFRDIRNVLDVRVAIDRRTGQPRGFAHADFVDIPSAQTGKEILNGKEVYGRKLRVDFSVGKERPSPRLNPAGKSEEPL